MIDRIGRYTVTRKIGEGGMGVVYAAYDPRLDRAVAIKTLRDPGADPSARDRLWREARAAARVSHPNIAQLFEIGDEDGQLFLAMELLEGEPLSARIARGPLPTDEAVSVALAVLSALEALHARGLVHRDLKPSNVFLTPVGVKLLDFGLARRVAAADDRTVDLAVTQAGTLVGTPRYMAPEQWREEEVGPPADLFAVGAILYEMLTGRYAFSGETMLKIYDAIAADEPPVLGGSTTAAALDRIIHRALRRDPAKRFPGASAMADALRTAQAEGDTLELVAPQRMRRLIVLPLRVLRPDPETDFLAFALSDAVTSSLSGLGSLIVRSSATASRFNGDAPNLEEIADKADVDVVLWGTILRAGDELRVTTQLAEAPTGTVLLSQTHQAPVGDLFQLQDALTRRIVESLAVPLSARDRASLHHDVPSSAQAYEFYLRANQITYQSRNWQLARDLYRQCLDLDPGFAPAWARLGRVYRVIGVYTGGDVDENYTLAQQAFHRALELSPDLSIAHNLSTALDVEVGRARDAMLRLLERARLRMNDAELFAGLVQAIRYCGLLDASVAAYERAHRLDPEIRTSVHHALMMRGDYQRAIETSREDPPFVSAVTLELMGRADEAVALCRKHEEQAVSPLVHDYFAAIRTLVQGDLEEARRITRRIVDRFYDRDPCARYYVSRYLARLGETDQALSFLRQSVEGGFTCYSFMVRDPWLDGLRAHPTFKEILRLAEREQRESRLAFLAAGGDKLLGLEQT